MLALAFWLTFNNGSVTLTAPSYPSALLKFFPGCIVCINSFLSSLTTCPFKLGLIDTGVPSFNFLFSNSFALTLDGNAESCISLSVKILSDTEN